jgi:hypothetical protein
LVSSVLPPQTLVQDHRHWFWYLSGVGPLKVLEEYNLARSEFARLKLSLVELQVLLSVNYHHDVDVMRRCFCVMVSHVTAGSVAGPTYCLSDRLGLLYPPRPCTGSRASLFDSFLVIVIWCWLSSES